MDRHEWTDPNTGINLLALPDDDLRPESIETARRHNRSHPLTVKGCAGREILRLAEELEKHKSLLLDELTRGREELRRIGEASERGHRELVAQLGAALGIEEPAAVLEPVFVKEPFATSMGGALLWAAFHLRARIRREVLAELMRRHQGKMPAWVIDEIADICPGEG